MLEHVQIHETVTIFGSSINVLVGHCLACRQMNSRNWAAMSEENKTEQSIQLGETTEMEEFLAMGTGAGKLGNNPGILGDNKIPDPATVIIY